MTCTCNNPGCQGSPGYAGIARKIADYGQQVIGVLAGDEDELPFAYTIGRTEQGRPELLIFARSNEHLHALSDLLYLLGPQEVKDGNLIRQADGQEMYLVVDLNNFPVMKAQAHEAFVVQADHYYGRPVDLLYLCPVSETGEEADLVEPEAEGMVVDPSRLH